MREPGAARWTAARWALRHVLARYLDRGPAEIGLTLGPHGKPRLATSPPPLDFNLSHSGGVALLAVGWVAVGVDVEEVRPGRDALALAERSFSPEDLAAVEGAAAEQRTAVFYQRWAQHEARLKCLGVGLGGAAPEAPGPIAVGAIDLGPGHAAAIAAAAPQLPRLRAWTFNPPRQKAE